MNDRASEEPLVGEVRFHVPLPLTIPLVALALIAGLAIGFAKVLLEIPSEAATIVALATAANILGAAAFVSLRPKVGSSTGLELLAIVAYPVLIGVVVAVLGIGQEAAPAAASDEKPAAAANVDATVTAESIAFDTGEISLPAEKDVKIEFDNQDSGIEHNIAIYKNESDALNKTDPIFQGQVFKGVDSEVYSFTAPKAGEYFFHCDIHPNMNGTVTVK